MFLIRRVEAWVARLGLFAEAKNEEAPDDRCNACKIEKELCFQTISVKCDNDEWPHQIPEALGLEMPPEVRIWLSILIFSS